MSALLFARKLRRFWREKNLHHIYAHKPVAALEERAAVLRTLKSTPLQFLKSLAAIIIALLVIAVFSFLAGRHALRPANFDTPPAHDELSYKINRAPLMRYSQSLLEIKFENPSENAYPVRLEIYDSDGALYISPKLEPGEGVESAELLRDLPAGQNELTARIVAIAPDGADLGYIEQPVKVTVGSY